MGNKELPKVAVLLAAYNGMQWIEEQVNSILEQKSVVVTIFFSVDLSTDGTEQWVKALAEQHANVVMLPYGERFGGAGPNFFRLIRDVDLCGFDTVAFSDQDDIWFKDKLQRAFSLIESGKCDVYSSNVMAFWPDGRKELIVKSQPQVRFDHLFEAAGPGCTYVFNAKSAVALQKFVRMLGERIKFVSLHDWFAYAFCREHGFQWLIDEEPSMLYRQHSDNQVGINSGFLAFKKRFQLIKGGWYREQVVTIVELVSPRHLADFKRSIFLLVNFKQLRRQTKDRWFLSLMVLIRMF